MFLQTKNGPLDFQAREPFHPMFGRMENTNQALELQITQEYTGQNKMLTYLAPMWEEVLKTDTYATACCRQALVGDIVDGSAQGHADTAIVGVANLGNADNLTGHHFSQANLFAFGRQAWDWKLDSEDIADDWVRMTWSNDDARRRHDREDDDGLVGGAGELSDAAGRRAPVHVQRPLRAQTRRVVHPGRLEPGLLQQGRQRRPGLRPLPHRQQLRPRSTSRHSSSATGTSTRRPENLLMWFHHVPWDHRMDSGRIFWDELVYRYQMGVQYVTWMRETWDSLEPYIDARRFAEVKAKLATHEADAADWRDTQRRTTGRSSAAGTIPVDDGPLSAKIVVDGKRVRRLRPVRRVVHDPRRRPARRQGSPTVRTADRGARYADRLAGRRAFPGRRSSRSRKDDFFGPIVKNYVFEISSR